ncbi:5-(carboxyamino)imidazole ribonucleotide synthase [Lyngbya confervoides]|uniref:N5-carboxyaminoimidazole ribonucleotide synthase n=1 Tax=Lyngbya confervoides BDU141951 TaxID=1574623 RepID=A0ABD4SYY9_9CYAN|nr:5-(carboxyamino)imidazole ribonucleotide synthase [Lyngbya confervoides]MCM1981514.1 5-(carboxyamino)imidazole ribonucleotide synthase [Lyngbya confervoides BDU141951]
MSDFVTPPAATIGIIGGGQLAMMMGEASLELGVQVWMQTPRRTDPALQAMEARDRPPQAVLAPVNDAQATAQLAQQCGVITFENEFVDLPALLRLEQSGVCFRPPLSALALVLDKFEQRSQLAKMGLPVPKFAALTPRDRPQDLGFDYPIVIKARRHGYDGQGTHIIQTPDALALFWEQTRASDTGFMVEAFVPFERELAIIAARSLIGEVALYPLIETCQVDQICRWAMAPVPLPPPVHHQANALARILLEQMQYIGVLGLELFLTASGTLLVNEVAPRTHNSGHLTIEGCVTSQFSQHLKAVSGQPLGSGDLKVPGVVMVNLLGFENQVAHYQDKRQQLSQYPRAHVHWYGKQESRVGRKLGHVTVVLDQGSDRSQAMETARAIEQLWYPPAS